MSISGNSVISCTAILALAILAGFYFKLHDVSPMQQRMNDILASMLKIEKDEPVNAGVHVAVGYGGCRDLFSTGNVVVSAPPETKANQQHHHSITSLKELQEMYALFFEAGGAAERYIPNKKLFSELVSVAEAHPGHWDELGGNAPVMASRFAKEGATVLLAARQSAYTASRLVKNITLSGKEQTQGGSSDIHLILEYNKGDSWGGYTAPRANRFIVHSDSVNPMIESLEDFGDKLQDFAPKLLVVSGLQMMDNFPFPKGVRQERLQLLKKQIVSTSSRGSLVHFELASFSEESLMKELAADILPNVHSIGMNEQELPNLHSIIMHGNVSLVSTQSPRVATVLDLMRQVFRTMTSQGASLSRLHVHTLAFQALMVKKGSPWQRNRAGATKAALTATRHVCGNSEISLAKSTLLMDDGFSVSEKEGSTRVNFNAEEPVACWTEDNLQVEVCVAPVLVCTAVKQTVGAGDNISAAALVQQI